MGIEQLISYIALGAPATRRPVTGSLPFLRPEIGFTPNWFHKSLGIDFGEKYHANPAYRREAILKMREAVDRRFPGTQIGKMDDQEGTLDLLTGVNGACSIVAMFGVPIRFANDNWPVSEHVHLSDVEMMNLRPIDPANNPFFQSILDQVEWIAAHEGKVVGFMNWQGVMNNAQRLRGPQLFMDMLIDPEMTRNLLECVCTTMIDSAKALQKKQMESGVSYTFFTVSNCLVNMLSSELYEEFILPFDQRIAEAFETIGIHNCAWNANPYLDKYASIPKLGYIDMGMDSDLNKASELFPDTRRAIMYTPMDLANRPIPEIQKDLEYIALNYGPCDIVAADIEDRTPDGKVRDLIQLCRDISGKFEIR